MTQNAGSQSLSTPDERGTAAQAFGTLATRLTTALGRARAALAPHTALLDNGVLAALDGVLAEFERRRVRIAIYGEVKAGKSTLINAIAGVPLSPVAFEPLTSIPVRLTYGETTAWQLGDRRLDSVEEVERLMRAGGSDAVTAGVTEIVVETNLDLLQLGGQVDLLDTPGVGSAVDLDAVSAEALRSLDAVVLVVRYPALFTQFTRSLMDGLQTDIGKLFVVWNLDADCAELTPEERTRHAETLRVNVAGAHELFLVDARAGYRAAQDENGGASVASGLTTFIAALRRFASSGRREVTALREAAKRVQRRLSDAQRRLTDRHAVLERTLTETRARLNAVQAAADSKTAAARARHADLEAAVGRIGEETTASVAKAAEDLRRRLRMVRRQWMRRGNQQALDAGVVDVRQQFADAVETATRTAGKSLEHTAKEFGSRISIALRPRTVPELSQLGPEDRLALATTGRMQWLRRTLWHRWYLPGVATFEHTSIGDDQNAHAMWLTGALQAARDAAAATLLSQVAGITRDADAERARIDAETQRAARQVEYDRLDQDLPVLVAQCEAVTQIGTQARTLIEGQ